MTDPKRITPEKILWIDLEMTGLNAGKDKIVEVAAIVTNWQFKELDCLETGVGQDAAEVRALFATNPFAKARPQETQQLMELSAAAPSQQKVEEQLVELVNKHFPAHTPALLGGNSVHKDREFIRAAWPRLDERLHYRMLDVSAWKVVMIGKYQLDFAKKESHRALDDIRESIAELKFYLQKFCK